MVMSREGKQTEWDGSAVLDAAVFRGQNLFALRVKGQSMKNIGILDGDLAICEPRQYAQNGEIVVALINNEEATVKPLSFSLSLSLSLSQ